MWLVVSRKRRLQVRSGWSVFVVLAVAYSLSGCREMQHEMDLYLSAAQEVWGSQGAALVAHDGKVILSEGYGNVVTGCVVRMGGEEVVGRKVE